MKKAIIYGATGLVGSYILQKLLNNSNYEQIVVVVRKELTIHHPKLKLLIGDYSTFARLTDGLKVDEIFIALGTTRKKTPDNKIYYQIDHDYPVSAAKIAKENGAQSVLLISAVGANAQSSFFYPRTKGQTELDIINLNFAHTHIFRPSMIMGNRIEHRPAEKIFQTLWKALNPLLHGKINKYKGIEAEQIATAMINATQKPSEKINRYHWYEMNQQNEEKE